MFHLRYLVSLVKEPEMRKIEDIKFRSISVNQTCLRKHNTNDNTEWNYEVGVRKKFKNLIPTTILRKDNMTDKQTHIIAVNQISETASTSPYSIYNIKYPLINPPFGIPKSIQGLARKHTKFSQIENQQTLQVF